MFIKFLCSFCRCFFVLLVYNILPHTNSRYHLQSLFTGSENLFLTSHFTSEHPLKDLYDPELDLEHLTLSNPMHRFSFFLKGFSILSYLFYNIQYYTYHITLCFFSI